MSGGTAAGAGGPGPHVNQAHRRFMVNARILACRLDARGPPPHRVPQTTVTEQRAAERERASALSVCSAFGAVLPPASPRNPKSEGVCRSAYDQSAGGEGSEVRAQS